jgi:hypothetical protein
MKNTPQGEPTMKRLIILLSGLLLSTATAVAATPDLSQIESMASAQVRIERLRKQQTPDWQAIGAQYEILAPLVKTVDQKNGLTYDSDIRKALECCARGERVKVNQQVLAKGLQHVVVMTIHEELDRLDRDPNAGQRIAAYFEGIRPTFIRRDRDFYDGQKNLEAAADASIAQLRNGGQAPISVRRELVDAIDRTYGLCVLYEIQEVEHLRATKRGKCAVKVKEAEIFYRIIQARIAKTSTDADARISGILTAEFDQMDAALLERELNRGLKGITLR